MKRFAWPLAAVLLAAAPAAGAQSTDMWAGLLATGVEGIGHAAGEAAVGGSSVFVTATGHARLPSPIADAYLVNIEGKSGSAVEASRLHDEHMKTAQAIAARFGVVMDVGTTGFTREVDPAAQRSSNARRQAEFQAQFAARQAGKPVPPLAVDDIEDKQIFVVRTGVRFKAPSAAQLPPLLDALAAAGIDDATGNLAGLRQPNFLGASQILGFGGLADVDDAVWDRASQDAMARARRQAAVLAAASGREIGEVKQIMLLTRSVEGEDVSVTISARYGFK
jgi:Protein of unknown function (DUF541)